MNTSCMKSNNIKSIFLYIIVFTISILTILLILFDNEIVYGYQLLWLLPLSFTLISVFTINILKNIQHNIVVAILWGGYFIRFVLTPLALKIGNYRMFFSFTVFGDKIQNAIFLMTYEIIIVFLFLSIYLRIHIHNKTSKKMKFKNLDNIFINEDNYRNMHFVILLLVVFCLCIYIYIPEIMDSYTWIFSDNLKIANIDYNVDEIAIRGTFKRALGSLFVFVFNIVRYLIPVYLLKFLSTRFRKSHLRYISSLFICMLPFLAINESNIQPFFGLLFNVIMMIKLYPKEKKKIIKTFLILGGSLVISLLLTKLYLLSNWQNTSGAESISLTINAYFPGVGNVAAAYNILRKNKWKTLFYDFFSTIPFRNSLFPSIAVKEIPLNDLFNNYNYTSGNIIPCISGAQYYLGLLIAPILPMLLSYIALRMKEKAESSNDYWYYFCYMFYSIRVAMIPTLYNHISIVVIIMNQFIPMYLITVFLNQYKCGKLVHAIKVKNISKQVEQYEH